MMYLNGTVCQCEMTCLEIGCQGLAKQVNIYSVPIGMYKEKQMCIIMLVTSLGNIQAAYQVKQVLLLFFSSSVH